MPLYARFDGFPGDCIRNGQRWITLDSFEEHIGRPGRTSVSDLTLLVHGMTAASYFYLYAANGKPIAFAEIELTKMEGAKELRFLLIHMDEVVITSATPRAQGPEVGVDFSKIKWTYTAVPQQPHPVQSALARLQRP